MESDILPLLAFIHFSAISTTAIIVLALAIVLLVISALASLAEASILHLSSFDYNDISLGTTRADKRLQTLLEQPERLQASLQISNTLANTSIAIFGLFIFHSVVEFSLPTGWSILWQILILSFFILIFGEIMPRMYAQNHPVRHIRRLSWFLSLTEKLGRPLSFLWRKGSDTIGQLNRKDMDASLNELSKVLEKTSDEMPEEKDMLEGIISLYSKTAVEIMTPRMDMASIEISSNFNEVINYVIEVEYSRIPVYAGNQDDIRGILYIKDLLPYLNQPSGFHWGKLIRPAFFVPETKKIDDLLEDFRTNKIHLAIVVDEFGGTSGLVTMEDILEEIVGEINDEYDDDDKKYVTLKDGSYIFDGKTLLTDFFRATGLDPKTFGKLTEEVDSLAGLVLEIKEDFPEPREIVSFDNYSFQVLEMDKQRIRKIKFKENSPIEEKEDK